MLHQLPDMQSLEALIRASPLYSRAYFDIQQEIFVAHTFKDLARRGVNLLPKDIESPMLLAWVDISIIGVCISRNVNYISLRAKLSDFEPCLGWASAA